MSNDRDDAEKLFSEHSDIECTVIFYGDDPWHETKIIPSLRVAALYARDNRSDEIRRTEIIAHTRDGDESIHGTMLEVLIREA